MLTAGNVKAVTGLPVNPRFTLGSVGAMTVLAEPLRLQEVVLSNSDLVKECISNATVSGFMTLGALKEGGSWGSCSPVTTQQSPIETLMEYMAHPRAEVKQLPVERQLSG